MKLSNDNFEAGDSVTVLDLGDDGWVLFRSTQRKCVQHSTVS